MNNMNGVGSYSAIQKNLYSSSVQSRKAAKTDDKKTEGKGSFAGIEKDLQ